MRYDFAIIGGGIVGLSTALATLNRWPAARVIVLEKEAACARHQTGHNSGVIHSGIYYHPGSLKAKLAVAGNRSMIEFCREHGIAHDICGKVIVATAQKELPQLDAIYRRGLENGLSVRLIDAKELNELEPHVRGLAAIHVPATGIVDYKKVVNKYVELLRAQGGELRLSSRLMRVVSKSDTLVCETTKGHVETRFVINCAGLHSDRVARISAADPGAQIVPFRGEYYSLKANRRHLVNNLIYPVPNPTFPFLGVHLTRMIDGEIHAGPNAVLALKREGYRKFDISLKDTAEILGYRGFQRLALRYWRDGLTEIGRSFFKSAFVRALQRLVPEIQSDDLVPAPNGVRAQAVAPEGRLVDDFLIVQSGRSLHVCNAPSPAATASTEIGRYVADAIPSLD